MANLHAIAKDSPIPCVLSDLCGYQKRILARTIQDEGKAPSEPEFGGGIWREPGDYAAVPGGTGKRTGSLPGTRPRLVCQRDPAPDAAAAEAPLRQRASVCTQLCGPESEIVQLTKFEQTDREIGASLHYQGPIFYIKRIFQVNGSPIAVNRIWLPEKFTPAGPVSAFAWIIRCPRP